MFTNSKRAKWESAKRRCSMSKYLLLSAIMFHPNRMHQRNVRSIRILNKKWIVELDKAIQDKNSVWEQCLDFVGFEMKMEKSRRRRNSTKYVHIKVKCNKGVWYRRRLTQFHMTQHHSYKNCVDGNGMVHLWDRKCDCDDCLISNK